MPSRSHADEAESWENEFPQNSSVVGTNLSDERHRSPLLARICLHTSSRLPPALVECTKDPSNSLC